MSETALAKATNAELGEELEEAGLSAAKEKAQQEAPGMIDVLSSIAKEKTSTDGARVSAAREILHQAEGRPATQKENAVQGGITIVLANFTVEGPAQEEVIQLPVEAEGGPLTEESLDAEFTVHETEDGMVLDLDDEEDELIE